jgi:amidase
MRPVLCIALLLLASLTTAALGQTVGAKNDDLSGAWILTEQFPDETRVRRLNWQVSGDKITGQTGSFKIEGTIANSIITMKWLTPDGRVARTFTGKAQDGALKGEGDWGGIKLQWSARRPATRSGGPRTHTFAPTEFHRVFSYAIPPALRIFPGETVQTKSVDAGGYDENSVRRSMGGNPQTGPFYIEGALPGDTLVVKLNRVRTNRDWAGSGQSVVGNALSPGYLMNLKRAENFSSRWKLDKGKGVAYLDKPTDPLKNFSVPLQPMLGCVGVAPPGRDVVATRDSGIFGGNMDYNQLREGTTVYLPVFQEGALLFMGDGHAAQGDGELTGDALETSMEFEFTVDVIPEKSISTPRAENAEYVMAIGIGGSLDQALQRATSEMARWLEGDYKLNSTEAAMILGFAVKYDVADLVGTQVSIVAKVPKTVLAQLKR